MTAVEHAGAVDRTTGVDSSGRRREIDLVASGMTCGSCAARVERTLAGQPGVERAAVNFATARARVTLDPAAVTVDELAAAVEEIGYGLAPVVDENVAEAAQADEEAAEQRGWLRRVLVAWPLGVAVLVLSLGYMSEPWARWGALALATPVQFWAGWPFLAGAAARARARTANMDTLIAVGTLAAYLFSNPVRHREHLGVQGRFICHVSRP